ncbi:TPA: hypothetical protein DCX16_02025 [bacterium]|nr:hypothetical protein [bacterium]
MKEIEKGKNKYKLKDLTVYEVSLVDKPANKESFLLLKTEEVGKEAEVSLEETIRDNAAEKKWNDIWRVIDKIVRAIKVIEDKDKKIDKVKKLFASLEGFISEYVGITTSSEKGAEVFEKEVMEDKKAETISEDKEIEMSKEEETEILKEEKTKILEENTVNKLETEELSKEEAIIKELTKTYSIVSSVNSKLDSISALLTDLVEIQKSKELQEETESLLQKENSFLIENIKTFVKKILDEKKNKGGEK